MFKTLFAVTLVAAPLAEAVDVQPLLDAGDFAGAKAQLKAALAADAGDHDARLALGVTTFLAGWEEAAQTAYAHGLKDVGSEFGMITGAGGLPVRMNPEPRKTSAGDVVGMIERVAEAMAEVDAILEPIGDAAARFDFTPGTVRMDLDGDGELAEDEGLWNLYDAVTNPRRRWGADDVAREKPEGTDDFVLGLDTADAYWLRGYANVFGALCDMVLAYDGTELFERTGHLFFWNVDTPYPWLGFGRPDGRFDFEPVLDFVAVIHLLDQPLRDANRMTEARVHLLEVLRLSRLNWAAIRAETDDANEWLPGPGQTGVLGVDITDEQVDAWLAVLDEMELILNGELLVPFWRGAAAGLFDEDGEWLGEEGDEMPEVGQTHPTLGVNVRRVFEEPTDFDLLLWMQGTAAAPYLEEGERADTDVWERAFEAFGENFPGFAVWMN